MEDARIPLCDALATILLSLSPVRLPAASIVAVAGRAGRGASLASEDKAQASLGGRRPRRPAPGVDVRATVPAALLLLL